MLTAIIIRAIDDFFSFFEYAHTGTQQGINPKENATTDPTLAKRHSHFVQALSDPCTPPLILLIFDHLALGLLFKK